MTTNNNPSVTIIMPAYNAAATIADSIESVLKQTYTNWELIIVNDCSTDNTSEIVKSYANTHIKMLRLNENKGISTARNVGARIASGEYIAFLDSDDVWLPKKLEIQIKYHLSNPFYMISHTAFEEFNNNKRRGRIWRQMFLRAKRKRGNLLPLLYYNNIVATLTVMMRKTLFIDLGGFDLGIHGCEDLDLWIRIAQCGYKFGYINEILARYRNSLDGISKNVSNYRRTVRKYIRERIIDNGMIHQSIKKRAIAGYYLMFGRLYEKRGDKRLARKYFIASFKQHHTDISIYIATILFLFINIIHVIFAMALGKKC
jgi:teichuronic acid biosynthesis glycosyltransferase TuaG